MKGQEAIEQTYNLSQMVLMSYIGDLDDSDLMQRPADGCNHIAWQLGHLISSEIGLLESVVPGHAVELPEGFGENTTKPTWAATTRRISAPRTSTWR